MQQDLFGSGGPKPKNELTLGKQNRQQLSKKQKEFNRLVKKLEKLRTELREMAERLDESLKFYGAHIHPLEQKIVTLRTTCVKIFFRSTRKRVCFRRTIKKRSEK